MFDEILGVCTIPVIGAVAALNEALDVKVEPLFDTFAQFMASADEENIDIEQ